MDELRTAGDSPGEPQANYGRWPFPVAPRSMPGLPRTFLVAAQRTAAKEAR